MTDFIYFLSSQGGLLVMLSLSAIWLWRRPSSRGARRALFALIAAWLLVSMWPVAALFSWPLTRAFHPAASSDVATGKTVIVLLGGGHLVLRDWDQRPIAMINTATESRIREAVRVYRMSSDAVIISSGGATVQSVWPNSDVMRDRLVYLGVPAERVLLESESQTTRDEAVIVAGMLPALHADRVVLVTSDTHMRRSVGAFRSANVAVVPSPARPRRWSGNWLNWSLPTADAFFHWTETVHEYLGIVSYRLRGWYR